MNLRGWAAIPTDSVAEIEAIDEHESFLPRALAARRVAPAQPPGISLDSTRELLRTVQATFPLISLHIEDAQPGACYIGQLTALREDAAVLSGVDPAGEWIEDEDYPYSSLTRVEFGGSYEEALAAVVDAKPFVLDE